MSIAETIRSEYSITPAPPAKRLFSSFIQAGFECSTHVLRNGMRLDLVTGTEHDVYVRQDYQRLKNQGISTAREGLRWHKIEATAGVFDFSTARTILNAAVQEGIEVIWDLLHFGWLDGMDPFGAEWIERFRNFAYAFAKFLRTESNAPVFIAPVNEMSFLSWAGGDVGVVNPFVLGRGVDLKVQLVKSFIAATQAVWSEIPEARIVSPEPVIHIIGDPNNAADVADAERGRCSMFEAWDMLSGRTRPELGGDSKYLDILGLNYYDRNQWHHHGATIPVDDPDFRPFREIVAEVFSRYGRPLFISETGSEDEARVPWFSYIASEVSAALSLGLPVEGICLYPILNHPGWEDNRHCYNGLWDYPNSHGERAIYQPLASEIREKQKILRSSYDHQSRKVV